MQVLRIFLAAFFLIAGLSSLCFAGEWHPVLEHTDLVPDYVVAVDKEAQRLHLLVHKSPLHAEASFSCATGQAVGDKVVEGDLKTPEGVYFTSGKRTGLTDFKLYGTMAFPLDFPNPVDRIKGKTGYGIWIHGRGKKLLPRDTKGCVALNNADIGALDAKIAPGTPVIIGKSLEWNDVSGSQKADSEELEALVYKWADDWKNRKDSFFEIYAPDLFSRSEQRPFRYFKNRKKRIFASTDWIDIEIFNLRALPGPDYWVTWFDQYYRSGKLSSSTSKRLYWQKVDGKWKIVGREYSPADGDLKDRYLNSRRAYVRKFIDKWRAGWLAGDLKEYMACYDSSARQGNRKGAGSISEYKKSVWETRSPASIKLGDISLAENPQGLEVSFRQDYSDVTGYSDKGFKKLVIRPSGDSWLIVDEQWSRL
ncbi:L,D-transpeptidase family protein [Maridesulfovibrio sp.]|uniref:L,D-transpeptidase family protein n=1 Tax=Maridesulfovibrio sp. TaxID=2795000 RepID=UPI002A18BDF8|nr:L,D-transpeptidase family protein [Maridesulfovibrio sp.]